MPSLLHYSTTALACIPHRGPLHTQGIQTHFLPLAHTFKVGLAVSLKPLHLCTSHSTTHHLPHTPLPLTCTAPYIQHLQAAALSSLQPGTTHVSHSGDRTGYKTGCDTRLPAHNASSLLDRTGPHLLRRLNRLGGTAVYALYHAGGPRRAARAHTTLRMRWPPHYGGKRHGTRGDNCALGRPG